MSYPPQQGGGYQSPAPQDHPRATTALILGILGVVLCYILAPFAWKIGKQAVNEIDASGGQLGGRLALGHTNCIGPSLRRRRDELPPAA